ncbi:Monooxygenase FAD-binding protein [Neofusicoccum parvum]|nr:Monooxygenase FAD-binding protein [Neofusicoccum parvum]
MDVEQAYEHGAELSIVSDGLVYGDLMGVSDEDSFAYGQALRNMATTKGFHHIKFLRVQDILQPVETVEISREKYLETVPSLRKELGSFLGSAFDVQHELNTNPDTQLTYRSFVDLLTNDMPFRRNFDQGILEDERRYDDEVRRLAVAMVERLVAYESLLRKSFPDFIRLSIHRSTGKEKIYIPLLPREGDFGKNPWNCSVARMANGEIRTGYRKDFSGVFDLVECDGKPYYFVERSLPVA